MIYELVADFVSSLKDEDIYKTYIEARQRVVSHETLSREIRTLERYRDEKEALSQYGEYANTKELDEKISKQRLLIDSYEEMRAYRKALLDLNNYLDELNSIIFANISDELVLGRMGKIYARHRR
ncbi:Cell fate regulator YlbF, YheA/YmcA/DUF963 family (controls sporulation, competence, biofilm development) [Kandleria vitulina]|uniref:YlbF family regulator n=1 Tax=Kandleria vitulina TaxID=1630 RepID=UPI00088EF5E4|nr:YlbF family regulator [Kandleria vitulina]MEE0987865.1 YlbF family regulator [Kandleria vitulina]SDL33288.1 Cell fate regulator YlbF, YheA/YmcA/DUF963 family (controls sporulation, competence, biofilm development) [Kandleria vitulina]SEI93313.1 Cell fate regulator YlbF, YheA/YmcA/DUF963 family (controls sporulation, competence, biofilm development) [Kandleria vitulina]